MDLEEAPKPTRDSLLKMVASEPLKSKKRKKTRKGGDMTTQEHLPVLALLGSNKNPKQRRAIIETLTKQQLRILNDLINSFLDSRFQIPEDQLTHLNNSRDKLYKFVISEGNDEEQKKILRQRGGFLQALIPLAAKAILPGLKGLLGL